MAGAGRLGTALASYEGFRRYRLDIVALFDTDAEKVGKTVGDKTAFPLSKLSKLAQSLNIQLGIIAVPAPSAQEIPELMVAGGIRAIWNFAPIPLKIPDHVWVENEDLAARLVTLSFHITQQNISERFDAEKDAM